jgi:excisionase family DNA binding protein
LEFFRRTFLTEGLRDRLLTAREVAELLDVSTGALLRWTRAGQVPAVKLPSGAIRYVPAQIDAWLAARSMTAGDGPEDVSPAPNATRRVGVVSSFASPAPLRRVAARTEEEHDGRT